MSKNEKNSGHYVPPSSRDERVRDLLLSPEQFAAKTGALLDFSPAQVHKWRMFWKQDICEKDEFHTWFPQLSLVEARRMWSAMEEHFLTKFERFLRVWPEWGSSGIWSVPHPGSRTAGGMVDYEDLPLPTELVERFQVWQAEYDEHEPWAPEKFDWERHARIADGLARDLKQCVGARIYVEHRELIEVLIDGTTRSCRPVLGLPEPG